MDNEEKKLVHEPAIGDTVEQYVLQKALDGVKGLRSFAELQADKVRRRTQQVLRDDPDSPLGIIIALGVQNGQEYRIIDKVDLHNTPSLLDDAQADIMAKSDIVEDLDSRIGIDAPFIEEIERIGTTCFDRGIPADRLKAFLESEDVLGFLVGEVLHREDSVYRRGNAKAIISSVVETLIKKMEKRLSRAKKYPVTAEVEAWIIAKIAYFGEEYDPRDKKYTIANFITELEKRFPEYDLFGWLSKNKKLITTLIRGREEGEYDPIKNSNSKRHVGEIIDEVYLKRGQLNPEQFINLHLADFFQVYNQDNIADSPSFIMKSIGLNKKDMNGVAIVDLKEMEDFFNYSMIKLQNDDQSLVQLREKLIHCCLARMRTNGQRIEKIIFIRNGISSYEDLDSDSAAEESFSQTVIDHCRTVSSHVDVRNLLSDPKTIPPEIAKNYEEWFSAEGKIKKQIYYRYLRKVFGQMEAKGEDDADDDSIRLEDEKFEKVRLRISDIFEMVDMYLASISIQLNIPSIQLGQIKNVNDYAELVKICCTSEDPQERFAARRKIELAFLLYSCQIAPRYVYQDYEAKAVKKVLERKGGIEIMEDEEMSLIFQDNPDGSITDITNTNESRVGAYSIPLIPANFAGVKCGLLPANNDKEHPDYMSKKTINSMLTNLLNEENKRAKDMTDLLRMTFVVDTMEDLVKIQEYIDTNYISFGRSLKREDRYKQTNGQDQVAVSQNDAKSADYKTSRSVVDIVVPDEHGENFAADLVPTYAVPVEIRVLLREDLMKERSAHHSASHRKYEKKRLIKKVVPTLAPKDVFPDHYIQEKPHENDIFEKTRLRLKTIDDSTKAA